MQRTRFISGQAPAGKFFDEKSGSSLFPYKDKTIKPRTIWKTKAEPHGMLMIMEETFFDAYDGTTRHRGWDVNWRSSDGKENQAWHMEDGDILKEFDPVFYVI